MKNNSEQVCWLAFKCARAFMCICLYEYLSTAVRALQCFCTRNDNNVSYMDLSSITDGIVLSTVCTYNWK